MLIIEVLDTSIQSQNEISHSSSFRLRKGFGSVIPCKAKYDLFLVRNTVFENHFENSLILDYFANFVTLCTLHMLTYQNICR